MASESVTSDRPSPIPEGMGHAVPYLSVRNAAEAIAFYMRAYGAVELMRVTMPDGVIGHAELRIGEARFMLADEFPGMGFVGPQTLGGTSVTIHVYVEDVDRFVARALEAGAKLLRPLENQSYGDRAATLEDPFGHRFIFASRVEIVSPEEMQRRARKVHEPE